MKDTQRAAIGETQRRKAATRREYAAGYAKRAASLTFDDWIVLQWALIEVQRLNEAKKRTMPQFDRLWRKLGFPRA